MESLYYEFELNLHRVYLEIDSPCSVMVWWKRNKHKAMSKKYHIGQRVQYIDLNEALKTSVKCKFQAGRPQPFTTSILVLICPDNSSNTLKQGGVIEDFDLTQIILPDNRRAAVSKRFQIKLDNSPPNSRILFTLSSKFLRDGGNEESQNDISFQGTSQALFNNRSQIDMTFRPPVNAEERNRKTSRSKEIVPMMKPTEIEEKMESPLQRAEYLKGENHRPEETEAGKNDKPLGFSFGPVGNPDRQRQNRAILEEVNNLREELSTQKRENQRLAAQLRARESQRGTVDDKKLLLLNQLNAAVNQCDQLKHEKEDLLLQINKFKEDCRKLRQDVKEKEILYGKAKDENRELALNFNKIRDELSDCSQKLQAKRKEADELRPKVEKLQRQNQQARNQLFKKQSQLINNENQLESVKIQYVNASKNVSIVEELKRVNQDLGRQRAELQRANNEKTAALEREQQLREQLTKKLMAAKDQFEFMKVNFIESYKNQESEFQSQIREFQQQMHHLRDQRQSLVQTHAQQISQFAIKNQQLSKRLEEELTKNSNSTSNAFQEIESLRIQVSEMKVKIKNHQQIYLNLQKDYSQKEKEVITKAEFIEKVREYVGKIEGENREKDQAIRERDEFITKAKDYITTKEATMLQEAEKSKRQLASYKQKVESYQKKISELSLSSNDNKEKEAFLAEIIRESNEKQQKIYELQSQLAEMNMILTEMERKIEEMQGYIEMQNERFQTNMDEVQELNRKLKSQDQTLSQLVKKNLDLEMQITMKNFEIRSLRGR